ncbi:MAG: fumarylacetoacetate hydrolase family protein [Cellvibrionaceae bacterium]
MKRRIYSLLLTTLLLASFSYAALSDSSIQYKKYAHIQYNGEARYGLVDGDSLQLIEGDIFSQYTLSDIRLLLNNVTFLAATKPSKIIAVGLNYRSHNGSIKGQNPKLFSKLTSSLTTHDKPIWLFSDSNNLHYEGEMVVVIGKEASNISVKEAPSYIFGVTAGNDVTDRNWQAYDLQWLRGKGADSFSPVSPWIATGLNYNDLLVETRVNGKVVQSESTKNLLFSVDEIVSYASQYFTLYPGDLIFTGTPGQTRPMDAGDIVEIEVEKVGKFKNTVTKKP